MISNYYSAAEEAYTAAERSAVLEASLCALRSADLTPERGCQTGASPLSRVLPGNAEWLRAQSADTANSVAYLRCPSSGPRTVLEDAELMASMWLRYGLACPNGHKSRDPAPRLDPTGDYRLWCRTFAGFRSARPGPARHDVLARELLAVARRADPGTVAV